MDMESNKKDIKVEIKVDENTATGVYSNFANIGHTPEEFVVDFLFVNMSPPPGFGKLVSRVVLTPGHAKRLYLALGEQLTQYEDSFGTITPVPKNHKIDILQ